MILKYIAVLIGLFIVFFFVEKGAINILGIEQKKISETPGKNIDRWGRGIIFVSFLITLWFVITINSDIITKFYWMTYLVLLTGFQAILEFIFLKESKQYISTIIILILGLIFLYNIDFFLSWD